MALKFISLLTFLFIITILGITPTAKAVDAADAGQPGKPCKTNLQDEGNDVRCKLPEDMQTAALNPALFENCNKASFNTVPDITGGGIAWPEEVLTNGKGIAKTLGRLCYLKLLWKARAKAQTQMSEGFGVDGQIPSINLYSGASEAGATTPYPNFFNVDPSERSDEGLYPGGDFFKKCQRIDYNGNGVGFNQLIKRQGGYQPDSDQVNFRAEYTKLMKEFHAAITMPTMRFGISTPDDEVEGNTNLYKNKLEEFGPKFKQLFSDARKCTAARFLVKSFINWGDADQTKKPADKQSFDGKIKCRSEGPETQDYWSCSATVDAYNAAEIADKGISTVQQIDFMNKQSEVQTDAMIHQKDDLTAPLKAQRDIVKKESEVAHLAGTVDLAKAAVLAGAMGSIPTISDIVSKCGELLKKSDSHQVQRDNYNYVLAVMRFHVNFLLYSITSRGPGANASAFNVTKVIPAANAQTYAGMQAGAGDEDNPGPTQQGSIDLCANVAANQGMNLAMNGPAKDAAKAAMIAAGLEGIANQAKGVILSGQADKIDDAIDGMAKFKPDLPTFASQDVMVQKCQADPTLPECSQFNFNHDVGFASNGISIGGMADGTSDPSILGSGADNVANATGANGDTNRAGVVKGIGGSVGGIVKPSGLTSTVGAAHFKGGAAAAAGGGGGAGPSALGGGAGGGGEGGGAAGGGAGVAGGSKVQYDGGGAKLAYSGGAGGGKSSATGAAENPFAKLFGDKKGESESSMDFGRGPASVGSQGANIFGMISNRYQQVNGSKRLLEYEAK